MVVAAAAADTGYAPPEPSYGAPEPEYGAPEPSYGAPEPSYGAPEPEYGPPEPSYDHHPKPSYRPRPRPRPLGGLLGLKNSLFSSISSLKAPVTNYRPAVRYLPIWLPSLKFFPKHVAIPIPRPTLVDVPLRVPRPVPVPKPFPVARPIPVPVKVHYEVPVLHTKEAGYGDGGHGHSKPSGGYGAPEASHGSSYESY